jgi:hypothetical protein
VAPDSVTVWLAMRVGATVTLTVLDEQKNHVMTGSRRSIALGANLHVVAVIARGAGLVEGTVYQYDVNFVFDDGAPGGLDDATGRSFGYSPYFLPSFALPPSDLTLLRLFQGSCRKPHADGPDALPILDDLIRQTATNGFARPHQLLLSGDQIYADDVAPIMLTMLTEASTALLGWTEALPAPPPYDTINTTSQIAPFMRRPLLDSQGFTSEDLDSHLMGLGEYLAMYLFVWSDVVWPTSGLPTLADVRNNIITQWRAFLGVDHLPPGVLPLKMDDEIEKTRDNLVGFRNSLSVARQVLANVPSYMIFDDHEVTDDWNMTRQFCRDVYGSTLGQRMVQNALVAYAFCQHWGNVPEDLLPAPPATPGSTLVALMDTPNPTAAGAFAQKAADYTRQSSQIRSLLGVHEAFALDARTDNAVFHDTFSLTYNYTVVGPKHQVIVTDTRTWRAYPTNDDGQTHLLTTDQFKRQILDAPDPGDRQLLVIVTTNAPPGQGIRSATLNDQVTNAIQHFPDLYEAWDLPSVSFDRLLTTLTSKLPVVSGTRTGSVVLLSGDVHFSFASRIIYRATNRFEETGPQPTAAVVAQLVASAIKNQNGLTKGLHRDGYFASPHPRILQRMIRHALTEGYVGWNFPKNSNTVVGTKLDDTEDTVIIKLKALTTVDVTPRYTAVILNRQPDYQYRLDYLLPASQSIQIRPPAIPPLPGGGSTVEDRKKAAQAYDAASGYYRRYNLAHPPQVVGLNNICEMRFEGATPATRKVNHIVRWMDPDSDSVAVTTYTVRLDVNTPTDKDFPDIPVTVTP